MSINENNIDSNIIDLLLEDVNLEIHSNLDDQDVIGTLLGDNFDSDFDNFN